MTVQGWIRRFAAILIYHDFGADSTGSNYGTELDARLEYTAPWKQVFAIKAADYDAKREFAITPEPGGGRKPASHGPLSFVVQKHAASRLFPGERQPR